MAKINVILTKEAIEAVYDKIGTYNNSNAGLTDEQITAVVDWMNTWEQLKDTVIPIRFVEDFKRKKGHEEAT